VASVSLYRKYRSQTFAEVVGQDHITSTLAQAVAEDRLHHAYLFTGPRGTGKTSTARILAKSLNCEQGPTAEPCNTCVHCTSITSGSHVDVIEIDAASHGGVDDVRDLRDRVAFAPAQARTKVYIVDECHMLSTAGWNAFLKTLEEPPGHVVFVFATTEPHKVLDTILSRTQRFDFKRIGAQPLSGLVVDLAAKESVRLEDGAVDLIVRAGDGSARDTLSVLDQVIAFTGSDVTVAGVAEVLGSIPSELLAETADLIGAGDVAGLCVLVGRVADAGHDLRQFAKDAVEHLRTLFLLQVAPDAALVTTTPERLARLQAQAATVGRTELLRAMELLTEAQAQMRRGATRLSLEIALAKAAMPEACGDPAALAARLDRVERGAAAAPAPQPAPKPAPQPQPEPAPQPQPQPEPQPEPQPAPQPEPAPRPVSEPDPDPEPEPAPRPAPEPDPDPEPGPAPEPASSPSPEPPRRQPSGDVDLGRVQQAWEAVLDTVKERTRRIHAFLAMSEPVGFDGSVLTLEFRAGYGLHAEQCGSPAGQDVIVGALERVLGIRPELRCVVSDNRTPPPPRPSAPSPSPSPSADDEAAAVAETEAAEAAGTAPDADARHDEAIARLESEFGATVVDDQRP
jgi:DNA polymerase III subunit gamma/tau